MSPQGYKRAFVKINNSPFCPPSFTSGGTGNRGDESPSLSFHFLPNPLHQLCQRVRKEAEGERKGGRRKKKQEKRAALYLTQKPQRTGEPSSYARVTLQKAGADCTSLFQGQGPVVMFQDPSWLPFTPTDLLLTAEWDAKPSKNIYEWLCECTTS